MELGRAGVGAGRWSCPFSSRMFGSEVFVLFFFFNYYFFSFKRFFGHAESSLLCAGFSLVTERGHSAVASPGLLITVASSIVENGL